jgi:uncharacterized protein YndB with AHSA1/START domain
MAEINIDRSLDQVWSVFTDIVTWKTWWGGDLKSVTPGWQAGARMAWAAGGPSSVCRFEEKKCVAVEDSWGGIVAWVFRPTVTGGTSVTMREDLSASRLGYASDAARAAREEKFASTLRELKHLVEAR